jgi:hypothetical protein
VSTETPTPTVVEGVNVLDSIGARVLGAVASRMKHQSPEALYGLR